jgi:hypothetical protein
LLGANETSAYSNKRAIIQSIDGGLASFITQGILTLSNDNGNVLVRDTRTYEGWKNE